MDIHLANFAPSIVGALLGACGALLVGLTIQRSQFRRLGRNACRAVFIEIEMNRLSVAMARDYASYLPLSRSAFDRLLPELSTWLAARNLRLVAAAYMSHAGYEQARMAADLPDGLRKQALSAIFDAHDAALTVIGLLAFTNAERKTSVSGELAAHDTGGG